MQADATSPLPKLALVDDVDTDGDTPVPQEKKAKHARPHTDPNTWLNMATPISHSYGGVRR